MRLPDRARLRRCVAALVAPLLLGFGDLAPADDLRCSPRVERAVDVGALRHRAGLLWEVKGPDGAVGHLLGTIHLALPEVTTLSPQLRETLASGSSFGMEVLFDAEALAAVAAAMRAPDGEGLRHDAEPALYARAVELLADYGIDEATAAGLRTWAVYTTLSLPPGQTALPLDLQLMLRAQASNVPVFGIETLAEQTALFANLSTADQVALLRETVCHYAAQQADMRQLVDAYVAGDLARLYREAMRYESPAQRRLLADLLDARNARMAERLLPRFATPGTFVAVGALHLPGPGGLLERLGDAGFSVRAIDR